uniref:Uncharacterized protein n=1 Tax=Molossus molossus TaxID=27622 RepID=A0A7J8I142_MOLMO|nr:hypothetical protein HJG59_010883 [Molossus molossus]
MHQEVSSIPSQGTCSGCGPDPQWGACRRQPINVLSHRCFSLFPLSQINIGENNFFFILTQGYFYIYLQIEQEGERDEEREKHLCERDTPCGRHPHDPNQGRGQTATEVRAPNGNRTQVSLVRRPTLQPLSQTCQGNFFFFKEKYIVRNQAISWLSKWISTLS